MENDTPQDDFEPESSPEDDFSSDEEMPVEDEQFPEEELPPEENEYSPEDEGVYPEDEQYPEENEDYPEDEAPLEDATYPEEEGEYPEEGEDYPEEEYEQSPESEQIPEDIEQPPETVSPQTQKSSPKAEEKNPVAGMIFLIILAVFGVCAVVYKFISSNKQQQEQQQQQQIEAETTALTIDTEKYTKIISSTSSVQEAKQEAKVEFTHNFGATTTEVTEIELLEETDIYYGIKVSWAHSDVTTWEPELYSKNVISFKKDVYDYEFMESLSGWTITSNQFGIKDRDTIKAILDAVNAIEENDNADIVWKDSTIREDNGKLIYEIKYNETIGGGDDIEGINHEIKRFLIDESTGRVEKKGSA